MQYPYCNLAHMQYSNACCSTRTMIDYMSSANSDQMIQYTGCANIAPLMTFNPLHYGMINVYEPPKPKSGRKVYRDLGDCWIVVAYESGPLKLLEIELK